MTDWEQEIRALEADWNDDYFPDVLIRDVLVAHYRFLGSDTPYNRRMLVRTVFAGMEGILNMLKDEFLEAAARGCSLSSAEVAALRQESYSVNSTGDLQVRPNFIPFGNTIRFLVKALNRHRSEALEVDFASHLWRNLQSSLAVRHRLTHPKARSDLEVSDEEVTQALSSFHWFMAFALRFKNGIIALSEGRTLPSSRSGDG